MSTVAHSTPYPWPYDGRLEATRLALLVVLTGADGTDVEELSRTDLDPVLGRIGELSGTVLAAGGVVVEVTTTPPLRGPDSPAAPRRIAATGLKSPSHRIVSGGVDGFFASPLDATLRALGRDRLLLCGQWLETSVHSTMRSANDRGYECLLVLDACLPYDAGLVDAARSQVEMSGGIFGAVGETAAVLDALGTTLERTSA